MSLISYLVDQIMAPVKRKRLFSGEYILFGEYLSQAELLYETSTALGYTYRDRLERFAESFSEPGRQASVTNLIMADELVTERLASLPQEPKNFYDFFLVSEGEKFMHYLHNAGLTPFSEWLDFPKAFKVKVPIKPPFERLTMNALEGIQLGSQHPELTEKLFSYKHDDKEWRFAYKAGLDIGPSPPKTLSLTELQSDAKTLIKPCIEKQRPDLLIKLGL